MGTLPQPQMQALLQQHPQGQRQGQHQGQQQPEQAAQLPSEAQPLQMQPQASTQSLHQSSSQQRLPSRRPSRHSNTSVGPSPRRGYLGSARRRCSSAQSAVQETSLSLRSPGAPPPAKQRFNLVGPGGSSTLLTSPRGTMGKAGRDLCPFHGKLSWQGKRAEETPGVRYAIPRIDYSKPLPGGSMGGAPRFSGGANNYPSWLLERNA